MNLIVKKIRTRELREKIRAAKIGRVPSQETISKLSARNRYNTFAQKGWKNIRKYALELQYMGFRVIPITDVIPDIIAVRKDKIYAIEIERGVPRFDKYDSEIKQFVDEIIWIIDPKSKHKYDDNNNKRSKSRSNSII